MMCDLSSMDSVKKFAKEFVEKHDRLNVLINNAGAVFRKRQTTVDGFERTLVVNYLGPFLLTYELLPLLKSSARALMTFSSLQKTQMGSNQPLGLMIGVIPMLPALMVPFFVPSYAMVIVISIAVVTLLVSLALLLLSSRLIPREKLLS